MGFIKKYLSLIIPAGLVLVAALLYIPTNMIGSSLASEIKSKSLG